MSVEATPKVTATVTAPVASPVTAPSVKPEPPKSETSDAVVTLAPAATVAPELGKKLHIVA